MAHDHSHDHEDEGPAVTQVVEDLGPCKKLLRVEVPKDEVQKEIDGRLEQIRRRVHLKGFRKGKAPRKRIEKLYGDAVIEDARKHLLQRSYMRAIEDGLGLDSVLGEGTIENVDFSRDDGLKFEVTLHTRPDFELPEYEGLEVEVTPIRVSDEDLKTAVDQFRKSRGELRPVQGEGAVVETEDDLAVTVEVWLADEYENFAQAREAGQQVELKPLKEEAGVEVQLPDDELGQYEVEDLADSLAGLEIGEWGEVETDLPDDFEVVEGRGEPAMLRVRIDEIKRIHLPELTEEWVEEAGYDSVADLHRELREQLQQHQEMVRRHEVEQKAIAKLLHTIGDFDLPSDLLEKEVENAERRKAIELRMQGKTEAEADEAVREERDEIASEVERMLRTFFLIDKVARKEGVKVTDRDVDARVARIAQSRGLDPRVVRGEIEKQEILPQLRQDLLDEKTRAILREKAVVKEDEA